jgi:hypothetical protein
MSADPGNAGADPSDPQSWNGYGYVNNNPMNRMDATGTCAVVIAGITQSYQSGSTIDGLANSLGA